MVGTGSAMVYVKMASSAFLLPREHEDSLQSSNAVPQWYIVVTSEQKIIAGAGVIANDFHDRPDLTPNVCALFVEKEYRNQGIAKEILSFIRKDMGALGISQLYVATDHTGFYERYEWEYLTTVQDNEGIPVYLYQLAIFTT